MTFYQQFTARLWRSFTRVGIVIHGMCISNIMSRNATMTWGTMIGYSISAFVTSAVICALQVYFDRKKRGLND
jgi:hypothetical protein